MVGMAEKDNLFTVKHTSVGTGTDPTILRDWVSRGYVEPADKSSGKGLPNRFNRLNLYQIRIFSNLVEAGVSREIASKVSKEFEIFNPGTPYLCVLKKEGNTQIKWMSKKDAKSADFERIVIIDVESIVKEVDLNVIDLM
jgi:hypothetical protein